MLTQARLKELVHYDPETGIFTRLRKSGNQKAGSVTGRIDPDGRVFISIHRKRYGAGRLAWFWMTGEWPEKEIDHQSTDHSDNSWGNLREATSAQNKWNTKVSKNNRAGLKGAFWHGQMKRWRSQIMKNGKLYNLGMFDTPEEAHAAYAAKAAELFGEFARAA